VGEEVWESVPEFDYQPPAYASILGGNSSNLLTLFAWVFASFAALYVAVSRIRGI
jgi:hypothetical protein